MNFVLLRHPSSYLYPGVFKYIRESICILIEKIIQDIWGRSAKTGIKQSFHKSRKMQYSCKLCWIFPILIVYWGFKTILVQLHQHQNALFTFFAFPSFLPIICWHSYLEPRRWIQDIADEHMLSFLITQQFTSQQRDKLVEGAWLQLDRWTDRCPTDQQALLENGAKELIDAHSYQVNPGMCCSVHCKRYVF